MNKKDKRKKSFDCVEWVREVRTKHDKEFAGLTLEARVDLIKEKARKNPLWKKFHHSETLDV